MQRKSLGFLAVVLFALLLGCSQSRHFAIGQRLENLGRFNDALGAYQAALAQSSSKQQAERSQIYLHMGECFLRLHRVREAFTSFEQAVATDGANGNARLRMGEIFLSAGLAERARDQAEVVMQIWPRNGEAVALWGEAMERLGNMAKAKEAYRDVLALEPHRVSVAIALADLYNQDDDIKQAKVVLEKSAEENPSDAEPLLALARLHEQEGDIGDAEIAYRQAVRVQDTPETNFRLAQFLQRTSRVADAEQVLRRIDAQHPTGTALADFELNAGRVTNALAGYAMALGAKSQPEKQTGSVVEEKVGLAARIVEADIELAAQKTGADQAAVLTHAREFLATHTRDMDAATLAVLQAEIALTENNLPVAAERAAYAVSMAPRSASALYTNGVVRLRCSDPAEARTLWLSALEADSHFAPARLALADQALLNGDAKGAEAYVLPVVRDEPGNMRALLVFARALAAQKQFFSALTIARRAQAVDGASAQPHVLLGQMTMAMHRPGEALIHFEQALLLDPHSRDAVEGLTRLYETGTITRPMLAAMEKVARTPPASATLLEVAGRLYAAHGWLTDSKRCLQAALRVDPQRISAAAQLAKAQAATGDLESAADSAARTGGDSATLLAAIKAQESNHLDLAIQNYERAVRAGEKSGVAANNLAWLYAQQGKNLGRALGLAQTARSLLPHDPAVLDTVGVVHLRMRSYSEAIKALESAQTLARRDPAATELLAQIRHHLTEAYLRAGNTGAALAIARE